MQVCYTMTLRSENANGHRYRAMFANLQKSENRDHFRGGRCWTKRDWFPNSEFANMHYVYGEANENGRAAYG